MVYIEYEYLRRKFTEAEERYDAILSEKEDLFERTQPKGIRYDRDKVSGGENPDKYADYLILKERKKIDKRLAEAKSMVDDRREQLKEKETELRASKAVLDRVYVMRFLDNVPAEEIGPAVNYSRSSIYRFLQIFEALTKDGMK